MFASTELAARVERADCGLLRAGAAAAERRRPGTRAFVMELAGGVATWTGDGSPLNKVAGLGFAGPLDEDALAAAETAFAERASPVQVELSSLAEPSIAPALTRRGYVLVGFESVLGRPLAAGAGQTFGHGIAVAASGAEEFDAWLDVVVTGFAQPDTQGVASHESFPREALARFIGDMASSAGFRRFLARVDGAPAGGASLRLGEGGVAQLAGAATLPAMRRRGVQTALLAARLNAATVAGCDLVVVTTQPGSKSQENVQRQGFALLYTRAVLVREGV
jgi:ribosomal protein S18 acetylase RimI-like enzyme